MIAEPYICTAGGRAGDIEWFTAKDETPKMPHWRPYADFEREKLRELAGRKGATMMIRLVPEHGFEMYFIRDDAGEFHDRSKSLIAYRTADYFNDTESGRLLKRAEFLKAVCEKEGVEWLQKEQQWPEGSWQCSCGEWMGPHRAVCHCGKSINDDSEGGYILPPNLQGEDRKKVIAALAKGLHSNPRCVNDPCVCGKPDREYYTRKDIDERMLAIIETLAASHECARPEGWWTRNVQDLRRRFLS